MVASMIVAWMAVLVMRREMTLRWRRTWGGGVVNGGRVGERHNNHGILVDGVAFFCWCKCKGRVGERVSCRRVVWLDVVCVTTV